MADDMISEVSQLCQMFEESEHLTRAAREKSERDRDYYDSKQWTAAEEAALKRRKQPVVTFNRIQRKVNSLLGLEKQSRKDPRAFPRMPDDEQSAQAATDSIRYICDDCRWDDKRSMAAENLIIEGTGAIFVGAKRGRNGFDPDLKRIGWDRLFWDPHSSEFDFSDATYMGQVIWTDLDEAKRKYPGKEDALDRTWESGRMSDTYDDKPKNHLWSDYRRRRVRIVEMYYIKDGEWQLCIFTKAGFLVDPQPSPYLDEDGEPENPIKAVSLYIDRENNRYGEVRTMIGPQDEINKRRSKALHLITMRQVRVGQGITTDLESVRRELAKPDGIIQGDKDEIEVLTTNDMAAANLQMLAEAKAEIDLLGPNAALQGKNDNDMSGRAILAQQQGGMLEAATLMDRIRCLSLMVYRAVWCRIRQHWTGERWIRVTDDQRNMRFVGLNRPVTMMEEFQNRLGDRAQDPEVQQRMAIVARMPEAAQPIRLENAVAELDVDIIIDEGIDTPTVAAEQFDSILKLAGTGMVPIPPDILIEMSSLPNKERLLERLNQQPGPEQQMQSKLQMRGAAAEVAGKEADAELTAAKAQNEAMKPLIEGYKAGAQAA